MEQVHVILSEIGRVLDRLDPEQVRQFIAAIRRARRIYIAGVGRSGLVVKAFGQRLMHLGFQVHMADEITAPGIARKDLLVCCSGTGRTQLTVFMARKAKSVGAAVASISATPGSPLWELSDCPLLLPAPLDGARQRGGLRTVQPARSLFEQATFLLLEAVILALKKEMGVREEQIARRHGNLE